MSHWYRIPRGISVRELLARTKQNIILDHSVPVELLMDLPGNLHSLANLRLDERLPCEKAVHLCQRSRGILLTTDSAYISLLSTEIRIPWGLILLPESREAKCEALHRLSTQNLAFRPGLEQHVLVELARHNRLFMDLRYNPPVISICCNSRWIS